MTEVVVQSCGDGGGGGCLVVGVLANKCLFSPSYLIFCIIGNVGSSTELINLGDRGCGS